MLTPLIWQLLYKPDLGLCKPQTTAWFFLNSSRQKVCKGLENSAYNLGKQKKIKNMRTFLTSLQIRRTWLLFVVITVVEEGTEDWESVCISMLIWSGIGALVVTWFCLGAAGAAEGSSSIPSLSSASVSVLLSIGSNIKHTSGTIVNRTCGSLWLPL